MAEAQTEYGRVGECFNGQKELTSIFFDRYIFFVSLIAPWIGLFTSTAALICAVMAFLKVKQVKLYVLVVLVVTVSFYIFFGLILKVSIPEVF